MEGKSDKGNESRLAASLDWLKPKFRQSLLQSRQMFLANYGIPAPVDESSQSLKLGVKVSDEYSIVRDTPAPVKKRPRDDSKLLTGPEGVPLLTAPPSKEEEKEGTLVVIPDAARGGEGADLGEMVDQIPAVKEKKQRLEGELALAEIQTPEGMSDSWRIRSALIRKARETKMLKPEWHAPWKLSKVIAGHLGWVRCVSVDPTNEWFATGAADRTIKIWDLASGQLKLTLTGHISTVMAIEISPRHPYLFSGGQDKMVKCWDLEQNKVIRHYHGHLSAVYSMALHPTVDVLVTGGRDSCARVWDIRTKSQVRVLGGHTSTVGSLICQPGQPQVVTGSHDSTIRLWDLSTGDCYTTLTNHKKSVRAMVVHPKEYTFASGSADNIKVWKCPEGKFLRNISGHNSIVNSLAVNRENVLVSGGDTGAMMFWDWKTGYNFQRIDAVVQPGSLDSEAGIFALTFDQTGSRLISCEADKSIKIYKEDEEATPQSHPVKFKPKTSKKY